MLGLMVNDPNIAPAELAELGVPTLVVAGTRDMIKEAHTRLIAASIPTRSSPSWKGITSWHTKALERSMQ